MRYTDELPVVDEKMMASPQWLWRRALLLLPRTKILDQPTVFKQRIGIHDLRIWRQSVPDGLEDFVCNSARVSGGLIRKLVCDYFWGAGHLYLNDGDELCSQRMAKGFSSEDLASILTERGFDSTMSKVLTDYLFNALTTVLLNLPKGAQLKYDKDYRRDQYNKYKYNHSDGFTNILLHLMNPGTPYRNFRTQAGDVTAHGSFVTHSFACLRPTQGLSYARLCPAFQVCYR
jgi:hypothetical protein